jgi:hypothetical protein
MSGSRAAGDSGSNPVRFHSLQGAFIMRRNIFLLAPTCVALLTALLLAGCKSSSSGTSDSGGTDKPGAIDEIRNAAAKKKSINNLKQIGLALHSYHDNHNYFPSPGPIPGKKAENPLQISPYSWRFEILPYIEQGNLYNSAMDARLSGKALPKTVADCIIKTYLSPLVSEPVPQTNYRVFVGNGAAFEWGRSLPLTAFTDGTSTTILAVESADPINWASLDDFNYDPKKPLPKLGIFPGGFHALMADCTVRWIPAGTSEATIRAMITRDGNESFEMPGTTD